MAHIGMKYPVAAPWQEGNTYGDGFVVAKAINFTGRGYRGWKNKDVYWKEADLQHRGRSKSMAE